MDRVFEKAFTAVIREQIIQNNPVSLDGLGTFSLKHIRQATSRTEDGTPVVTPPKDVIVFKQAGESA
ncbi:MAG: nucleoid DNA-binding protein [Bacteroidetes bacterium HLUCCA01]|nr:MAG: nucleoid DNA-binding protein [Bacteroidetes bacterium HLUCCA01]